MKDRTLATLILPLLALLAPVAHAQSGQSMSPMPQSDQTMPQPMPGPMRGPMTMAPGAMDCPRMHREMMEEMRSLRQEIAELREELRRRQR